MQASRAIVSVAPDRLRCARAVLGQLTAPTRRTKTRKDPLFRGGLFLLKRPARELLEVEVLRHEVLQRVLRESVDAVDLLGLQRVEDLTGRVSLGLEEHRQLLRRELRVSLEAGCPEGRTLDVRGLRSVR